MVLLLWIIVAVWLGTVSGDPVPTVPVESLQNGTQIHGVEVLRTNQSANGERLLLDDGDGGSSGWSKKPLIYGGVGSILLVIFLWAFRFYRCYKCCSRRVEKKRAKDQARSPENTYVHQGAPEPSRFQQGGPSTSQNWTRERVEVLSDPRPQQGSGAQHPGTYYQGGVAPAPRYPQPQPGPPGWSQNSGGVYQPPQGQPFESQAVQPTAPPDSSYRPSTSVPYYT